jgi:hypothetical protein
VCPAAGTLGEQGRLHTERCPLAAHTVWTRTTHEPPLDISHVPQERLRRDKARLEQVRVIDVEEVLLVRREVDRELRQRLIIVLDCYRFPT